MELLVLGDRPAEYIEMTAGYLNQCGIYCCETRTAAGTFTIEIDDCLQSPFQIDCTCEELNPIDAIRKLEELSVIRDVPNVISISNIKWFPEFRYNVDEDWRGIDQWVDWDIYRKKIRSVFQSAKFSWVFSNAEKISMCSRFFEDRKNSPALHLSLQPPCNTNIPELMERFFIEIGEERFWQETRSRCEAVGFLFSPDINVNLNQIGEKTNIYWTLYSFLQASGPESNKLYERLFTDGGRMDPD